MVVSGVIIKAKLLMAVPFLSKPDVLSGARKWCYSNCSQQSRHYYGTSCTSYCCLGEIYADINCLNVTTVDLNPTQQKPELMYCSITINTIWL